LVAVDEVEFAYRRAKGEEDEEEQDTYSVPAYDDDSSSGDSDVDSLDLHEGRWRRLVAVDEVEFAYRRAETVAAYEDSSSAGNLESLVIYVPTLPPHEDNRQAEEADEPAVDTEVASEDNVLVESVVTIPGAVEPPRRSRRIQQRKDYSEASMARRVTMEDGSVKFL
jgi:hypothetical protein